MRHYVGPEGKAELLKTDGDLPLIVDVLRASSTIIAALSRGAEQVIPVEDEAEALRLGKALNAVTIGERHGIKIEGFDHGNSPTEMLSLDLKGKIVVITTTNGTRVMVEGGIIASTLNAGVVADRIRSKPHVYLLASGAPLKSDEDRCAACLIELIASIIADGKDVEAAVKSASSSPEGIASLDGIRTSASGQKLTAYGYGQDVEMICTAINTYSILPVYRKGAIRLESLK